MTDSISISDNNFVGKPIPTEVAEKLMPFSGLAISELQLSDNQNLLIFPQKLNQYGDDIGKSSIFTIREENGVRKLCTGNIMGFVGFGDTKIRIYSRFSKDDKSDYFLHYMLQKVLSINLFDLNYNTDEESILDFLIYLFPSMLKNAVRQGIYKEYQTRKYNDANVKGRIDINRHIRFNIPFNGKVAYTTREYAYDNHVTQLIRHTIEYISHLPLASGILQNDEDTMDAVRQIKEATPSYQQNGRREIVNKNIRPLYHPYYYEYRALQQLCMQILRHEEIKYGNNDDEIYGILFDGAWLWEMYLDKVLKNHHLKWDYQKGAYLFRNNLGGSPFQEIVPDFYNSKENIVADAKYIPLDGKDGLSGDSAREVYYKTITYMYRFNSQLSYLFYPHPSDKPDRIEYQIIGTNGKLVKLGLPIPTAESFLEFKDAIRDNEQKFVSGLFS